MNERKNPQDKEAVLEAMGIGPIRQLKQEQMQEDQLLGKLLSKAQEGPFHPLESRLSTINEDDSESVPDLA